MHKFLFTGKLISSLAVSSWLLVGLPVITVAQELPGLTLFGGIKTEHQLPFRLDFGGEADNWDRYILRIPASKMRLAAAKFSISYPDYYDGIFDTKKVEVIYKGKEVAVSDVTWDKDARLLEISPVEPLPAGGEVRLVLSNVQNPPVGGMYYFNCRILGVGDVPVPRYVGTWVLSIS